jgi:phosphopantothenoylcysteine synthetase/decarboxylase
MRLKDKNIILGITGSIAAYKAAFLTRLLKKEGANVKIILTPYGKEFITPVTLATLSQNSVLMDFFHHDDGSWNSHVELGIWADVMLIAPITANTIGKMAHGIADNLLITTYLSARCPVIIAPAMDLDMFQHPTTLENIKKLQSFGNIVIEPSTGELASGLEGKGRMEDPEKIVDFLNDFFNKKKKASR